MNRSVFRRLLDEVRTVLIRNDSMGARRNGVVEPEVRLGIKLRIAACASDLDLMNVWNIARPTLYYVFHETVEALMQVLPFPAFLSTTEACSVRSLGSGTSRRRVNSLPGCVGSLDGISICITKRKESDCANTSSYYHRKGYFSLPIQAICDSRYRFSFVSGKCSGPTHDSVAFSASSYAKWLDEGNLPNGYRIAADEANVCSETIITPFPSSTATP